MWIVLREDNAIIRLLVTSAHAVLHYRPRGVSKTPGSPPRRRRWPVKPGGLINVMRSCGISAGVAAASALLAWRLAVLTGSGHNTLHAQAHELLEASRDVIVLLAGFAAIAGAMSLTRPLLRSRGPSDARGCP